MTHITKRKYVANELLYEFVLPESDQYIVKVSVHLKIGSHLIFIFTCAIATLWPVPFLLVRRQESVDIAERLE